MMGGDWGRLMEIGGERWRLGENDGNCMKFSNVAKLCKSLRDRGSSHGRSERHRPSSPGQLPEENFSSENAKKKNNHNDFHMFSYDFIMIFICFHMYLLQKSKKKHKETVGRYPKLCCCCRVAAGMAWPGEKKTTHKVGEFCVRLWLNGRSVIPAKWEDDGR